MIRIATARIVSKRTCANLGSFPSRATFSTQDTEWRKQQLDKLEQKFQQPLQITNDEDLQPMWKEMESRVTRRRTRTKEQADGKLGRKNIKKTDEEAWLQAGLYDDKEDETSDECDSK